MGFLTNGNIIKILYIVASLDVSKTVSHETKCRDFFCNLVVSVPKETNALFELIKTEYRPCPCDASEGSPTETCNRAFEVNLQHNFGTESTSSVSKNRSQDFQSEIRDWLNVTSRHFYCRKRKLSSDCFHEDLPNTERATTIVTFIPESNKTERIGIQYDCTSRIEGRVASISIYATRVPPEDISIDCDCSPPDVKEALWNNKYLDFNDITCKSYLSKALILLSKIDEVKLCSFETSNKLLMLILLSVFAVFVVIISAAAVVWYRNKKIVNLWLFKHGCCLRCVTEEHVDEDKVYDAFVSYSSHDVEWVANNLVRGLECGNPSYKLCLHNRNWLVGEWVADQILKSVQESRRTIVVLTDNFVNSTWSRMEFAAAYKQAISDRVNRVLIVVPGEIPEDDKFGEKLKNYISLNTYLKWNDPHFWRKLRSAMPRTRPRLHHQIETNT